VMLAGIEQARLSGANQRRSCEVMGVDARTIQRWASNQEGEDRRRGPRSAPHNRLSESEKKRVIETTTSVEHRNLSPKQIVPKLADCGEYIASESSFYRALAEEKMSEHRGRTKPREPRRVLELVADKPLVVWSWDITYLRSATQRGTFFYLYLIIDVWSRKIVGARVHENEDGELASQLVKNAIISEGAAADELALHQDNGGPMKSSTLKATLEQLGVMPSYSRPGVSDDNSFSESAFRTLKYRPGYPSDGFKDIEAARTWVSDFVEWYNNEHLHSALGFTTPAERHHGLADATLRRRSAVYEAAKAKHPERWGRRKTRDWSAPKTVILNPSRETKTAKLSHAA
jgi:putative transposase